MWPSTFRQRLHNFFTFSAFSSQLANVICLHKHVLASSMYLRYRIDGTIVLYLFLKASGIKYVRAHHRHAGKCMGLLSIRKLRNIRSEVRAIWTFTLSLIFLQNCWVFAGWSKSSKTIVPNFTFMWPCIVTNFFVTKPTRCTNYTNLFCHETVNVSDSSSVHHQEIIHCTLSSGMCHTGL